MSTLSAIRTLVRTELGEPSAGYWTDAQLNSYINAAAARFSTDTGILLAPPRRADAIAGCALYTLPSDCPGPQAVIGVYFAGAQLLPTSPAALMRLGKSPHADTGAPEFWYTVADEGEVCLALYPIPSADAAGAIVVWHWKVAAEMTTEGAVCEIPGEYIRGVVWAACELAFLAKRETAQAAACRALYDDEVRRARSAAESLVAASLAHRDSASEKARGIF